MIDIMDFSNFSPQYLSHCYIYLMFMLVLGVAANVRRTIRVKKMAHGAIKVTPKEFFSLRKNSETFPGVYLLYNHTKKIYYVRQSRSVYSRVNNHFTGHGNGDVYADYKYGDDWGQSRLFLTLFFSLISLLFFIIILTF